MDSHATTPVDSRVLEAMLPFFTEHFGNASSKTHAFGWTADQAVRRARQQVADLIGARPREIVFTSGATESDNLAVLGAARTGRERGNHVITVVTEHRAVLDSCRQLEQEGMRVTVLPVESDGLLDVEKLVDAFSPDTLLVSVMAANNEIGVLQPLAAIGRATRARGILFHTDAAQAAGKVPFDVDDLQVDLVSLTAHKMYGPKGVGALYVRRGTAVAPMVFGGGHEAGLRSGTLNVPGIVGFGAAAALGASVRAEEAACLGTLRDRLYAGIQRKVDGVILNGSMSARLPQNLNISFERVDGDALLTGLVDVAVSPGAACSSVSREPSYVLRALGRSDALARASIRFGLARATTEADVDRVVDSVAGLVGRLRAGPAFEAFEEEGEGGESTPARWH